MTALACGSPATRPQAPRIAAQYQAVFAAVDDDALMSRLGELAVERFTPEGQARFRDAWTAAMEARGLAVTPFDYPGGRDLEAVLPGKSPDSVVIVVHYDSTGAAGREAENPGADDDMTGMSIMLETARVLAPYRGRLQRTVRFVATDHEEDHTLAGARAYAAALRDRAAAEGFRIVAAIDDEQTGWSCRAANACPGGTWPLFDVYSCGAGSDALAGSFETVVRATTSLSVQRGCASGASDNTAFAEIGVPNLFFTEHDALRNPHFDQLGSDRLETIDRAYFTSIARPAIAFAATVVGIDP